MGRKLRSTDKDSNFKKKSTSKKYTRSDLGPRKTVLQMTCEKLKSEIKLNEIKKNVVLKARENIELQIDILKLNLFYLMEKVSSLKTLNAELSYKCKSFSSVCDKSPENLQNTCTKQTQQNDNGEKKTENVKFSPYVVLLPNNKSNESKTMKKFFIGEIYGNFINQQFELDSKEPFQIFPLETDVILKSEYLDKLKKVVLECFESIGTADVVPYVSLSKKDVQLEYLDEQVIDLTEKEDCSETNYDVSNDAENIDDEKPKLEIEHDFSQSLLVERYNKPVTIKQTNKRKRISDNDQDVPCIDID